MRVRKLLCSILALAMVLSTMGTAAFAEVNAADVWDGTVDTSWYNDTDTEFTITTAEQWAGLAYLVNGAQSDNPVVNDYETADFGYYTGKSAPVSNANTVSFEGKTIKLAADLDFRATYANGDPVLLLGGGENLSMMPVGYSKNTPFKGTFDGQGHTIKNLFQGGWDMYGYADSSDGVYLGLFGVVEDATIKNLVVDNFSFNCEMNLGTIAGLSGGKSTFDNITVKNSTVDNSGGWWVGGLIGWAYGNQTIKNITIDETNTIAQDYGHYDTAVGGIIGGCDNIDGESIAFINCDVSCKLDVYNDCTANYDTGVYRNCGMLIGGIGESEEIVIDGVKYPDFEAKGLSFDNVNVTIGEWANYTYCWSYALTHNCQRIEPGVGYKGVDVSTLDDYSITSRPFDAIFGAENAGDLSSVRGPVDVRVMNFLDVEGVTVTDKAIIARNEAKIVGGEGKEDVYFTTLQDAIDAAEDGNTIALVKTLAASDVVTINKNVTIDLAENTLSFAPHSAARSISLGQLQVQDGADVRIDNGIIDFTGAGQAYNVLIGKGTLTLGEDVTIIGDGFSGNAFCLTYKESKLVLDGTKVVLKNQAYNDGTYFIKTEPDFGYPTVEIKNADITIINGQGFMNNSIATIENSKINLVNMQQHGLRNVSGTITDTELSIDTKEDGIKITTGELLTISGDSKVLIDAEGKAYNATSSELAITGGKYSVDPSAFVTGGFQAEKGANLWGIIEDEDVAEKVYVQFKKTDINDADEDTLEGSDKFDIVLAGFDGQKINELASADLTFSFDGQKAVSDGAFGYAVASAKDVTLSQTGKPDEKDRFMFNFSGIEKYEESGEAIVIGHITVTGYGKYSLGMAEKTTNAVYATTINDNLVDGYTAAAELVINKDMVSADGMVGSINGEEIKVPTRNLKINVTFPNAVKTDNAKLYQGMQVKIEGGTVKKELALGEATYTEDANVLYPATVTVNDNDFVITADLPYNTTYTVTVSGAGYRTATYSVVLTDNKELTFWNNVMDDDKEIEKNNANSATKKNFLAGDIVKDNKINIYDLSAVVSYFGKIDLTEAQGGEDFAKYDLDRDGKIDAKDVAYVLVSWGN